MQFHFLLALASLGVASALPQEGGSQPSGGQSSGGQQSGGQAEAAPGQPGGVPMDLAGGFKPDQIQLQMSFTGDASEGLKSGAKVKQQDAMKEPQFALGDSSGVNTRAMFVILIVDTTSKDQRMLHYVKSDYMATGQKTQLASKKEAKMQYMGPGTMGDQGQGRQYTALMYQQKGEFPGMGMPEPGKPVVVPDFAKMNGLDKAIAGTNIQVDTQSMGGSMGGQMQGGQMQSGGQMMQGGEMASSSQPMASSPPMPMPMPAGGEMGGSSSGQPMPMPAGGEIMGGGQSMPAASESSAAAGGMVADAPSATGAPASPEGAAGGAAGGAGAPAGAAPTGAMPSGMMMNGSMPTMGMPSPSVPSAAASSPATSAPATGAAATAPSWSTAVALAAVGGFAVALF